MIEVNFPKPIILPVTGVEKDSVYTPDEMTVKNINKRYPHGGTFDMTNVTVINKDALLELSNNFFKAYDELVADDKMIVNSIQGDDKFFLKKTKYNIEIRSDESTTWLSYVRLNNNDNAKNRQYLCLKYIYLIKNSNPNHFDALRNSGSDNKEIN